MGSTKETRSRLRQFHVWLPPGNMWTYVRWYAEENGVTYSEVVRRALKLLMRKERMPEDAAPV